MKLPYELRVEFALLLMFVVEWTSGNIDLNQLKSQIPQDILSNSLSNITLPIDDMRKLLREKCLKVSGSEDPANDIEEGQFKFAECLTDIFNFTAIESEIEAARPAGELDVVFNNYCNKRPDALKCVTNFTNTLETCLDKDEKDSMDVFMRIITSLLDFVCYKGGDQIALFIAEKGPECLSQNERAIRNCLNKTFSSYIPKQGDMLALEDLPKFVIGEKQCDEIDEFSTCVVDSLQKCEEITPANIVESLFRFIRKEIMCPGAKSNQVNTFSHLDTRIVGVLSFLALIVGRFSQ